MVTARRRRRNGLVSPTLFVFATFDVNRPDSQEIDPTVGARARRGRHGEEVFMSLRPGRLYGAAFALAMIGAACQRPITPVVSGTPVPNAAGPMPVVNLDQGWDEKTQQAFWFTSQGSQIVPYAWFLALEQAASTDLLRSDASTLGFGYIPAKPGPGGWNPDGLPVGFVKAVNQRDQSQWMGVTCAACHTRQINIGGVGLRIDGGPALGDLDGLIVALDAAMSATLTDAAKFGRFAERVLGASPPPEKAAALRAELTKVRDESVARYTLFKPTRPSGHGRVDAFGAIFNQMLVAALAQPSNLVPPDAPVSYPFLWDTPQHDKVQWNGSAPNGPFRIGELARNTGEVIGVFGGLKLDACDRDGCKYPNHIQIANLGKLESWVRELWSPKWDPKYLGPIDQTLAGQGKAHYDAYCVKCHVILNRTSPTRTITAVMEDVGTDPAMATASATRMAQTGPLDGTIKSIIPLRRFGATDAGGQILINGVVGVLKDDFAATLEALYDEYKEQSDAEPKLAAQRARGLGSKPSPEALRAAMDKLVADRQALVEQQLGAATVLARGPTRYATYKARPLNGIWATAPYLHNGSVPNLAELLKTPDSRVTTFFVGSWDFDAVNVGMESTKGPFRFDTTLPGNSNAGHTAGTKELTADQKRALLEYLKTL
jgi:hypothetical protein